ncbi:DUF3307 domain-containing protein [Bacillus sp. SN10]|uniref:DUF3307 domain-containing protein n=1 Tax=Bacillus sp. SN10 TaxID=2056493 RepID=UPI001E56E0B1|nr:DUF3307 domain-containing protein [Bacillus sp. SN10]
MLVLILLIAHLFADYPLQTDFIKNNKKTLKGLLLHITIHFSLGLILSSAYIVYFGKGIEVLLKVILCLVFIVVVHFIVDYFKGKLNGWVNKKSESYKESILCAIIYVLDQLIHCVTIIYSVQMIFKENYQVFNKIISLITLEKGFQLEMSTKVLFTAIIFLLNIYFVGYLIGILLKSFRPKNLVVETVMEVPFKSVVNGSLYYKDFRNSDVEGMLDKKITEINSISAQRKITFIKDSPANAGMWIGVLERTIILILCMINSISSIGFIIAMKALTRFKQFDDKSFAEYYLIGSMFSIIFAIINGYLIRNIWM